MPRVVHFEINADQPERAATFYRDIFGWEIKKWNGPMDYWMVMTGDKSQPGIDGGLLPRNGPAGTINTIDVPSVDEYTAKVTAHGGQVVLPKMAVPGVGWLAYCKDTEDNVFGIIQFNPEAK